MANPTKKDEKELAKLNADVEKAREKFLTAYEAEKTKQGVALNLQAAPATVQALHADLVAARAERNALLASLRSSGTNV